MNSQPLFIRDSSCGERLKSVREPGRRNLGPGISTRLAGRRTGPRRRKRDSFVFSFGSEAIA